MRYALIVEYCGTNYFGWQRQTHFISVQAILEKSLSLVAAHQISVICAGRTDRGVHATAQVVHFDSDATRRCAQWVSGVNCNLPADIKVKKCFVVDDKFHARYSATSRTYQYYIYNSRVASAIYDPFSLWVKYDLSLEAMQNAAKILQGKHDFSSFRASNCQAKSSIKNVTELSVKKHKEFYVITVSADSFLYHMVRNIVGALLEVASGSKDINWIEQVLAAKDRKGAGKKVAAKGLFFRGADYADNCEIKHNSVEYVI